MHPFNWDNDPASECWIPPNGAVHLMNAVRAVQVVRREHQYGHCSAVLDRIHLPDNGFSYFKPLAINVDICPAGSKTWNETVPNPIALIVVVAYKD